MSELGDFLRETREEKQLTLDEIQEKTKIRKRYIEAIESGNYTVLPGQFYARAFIKRYVEALGLKSEQVLAAYRSDLPEVPSSPSVTPVVRRTSRKKMRKGSPKTGKWISRLVLYAFLILLIFFVWLAVQHYLETAEEAPLDRTPGITGEGNIHTDDTNEQNNNENTEPEEENEDDLIEEPLPEPELSFVETEGRHSTFVFSGADEMQVTLEADGNRVWYRFFVTASDETIAEGTLSADEKIEWDVTEHEQVTLHIGNMRDTVIHVNGLAADVSELPDGHFIHIVYELADELNLEDNNESGE